MAVTRATRPVGQHAGIPRDVFERELRAAETRRARARVRRQTTAATDVTRARSPRMAGSDARQRPTTSFDPRDGAGQRLVGTVRDQAANDRRCIAHATAAAIEAFISRKSASVAALPSISVGHVFELSGKQEALDATADGVADGVLETACFPPTPACGDPSQRSWRVAMSFLGDEDDLVAEICAAVRANSVPVIVVPTFDNFMAFTGSGVYTPAGQSRDAHALCVIGYEVTAGSGVWIVQNSFGTDWGDGGFARIRWEDRDLGPEKIACRVQGVVPPGT
jgi:C1A family cysteine protease